MYDDRPALTLAYFAIFHKPSEAVSTYSLCAVLRAFSNLVFRFLARLYRSHDSSARIRFAILPNRLASICASLHSFVNPATNLKLWAWPAPWDNLVDRSVNRQHDGVCKVNDFLRGSSRWYYRNLSLTMLKIFGYLFLHNLLGVVDCCPI